MSLVGPTKEAGEDCHGKHLPDDLHVVRPHYAHHLSIVCRFSVSSTIPALRGWPLVGSTDEAGKDGG
jgi:hypothetical protein